MRSSGLAILAILLLCASAAAEESLLRLLDVEAAERLLARGEIRSSFGRGEAPTVMPGLPQKDRLLEEIDDLQPTAGVEYSLLYVPPASISEGPGFPQRIYNTLRAFSTLAGIEYYSESRGRMRILFHEAYVIDSPKSKNRIEDPVFSSPPGSSAAFGLLHDSSLGKYVAAVDYTYDGVVISMSITNTTPIRRLLLPIVGPGGLRTFVILAPTEEGILFYGLVYVKTTNLSNLAGDMTGSFYNRLTALFEWFRGNLESG